MTAGVGRNYICVIYNYGGAGLARLVCTVSVISRKLRIALPVKDNPSHASRNINPPAYNTYIYKARIVCIQIYINRCAWHIIVIILFTAVDKDQDGQEIK